MMLQNSAIPSERAWFTWSERPAEMVFLPLGVRLTPLAYAGSTGTATLFPPGPSVTYGAHAPDARRVALDLDHAGTRLAWTYDKIDPFAVLGSWRARAFGEWGLRFWINLCLSAETGAPVRFDASSGAAIVKVGTRFVALVGAEPPVQVTGHASVEATAADYEAHGYFHLASRAIEAKVLALRYNLEMMRDGRFALAVADREDLAVARARAVLDAPARSAEVATQTGRFAGALDAIRDVMSWNTVWDGINGRPYTSISRNWNQRKFGGFGVWLNDQLYAALLTGWLDPEVARENLMAALSSATPQGNLACLVTANDAWVDRTQLPIGAFLTWLIYLRGRSRAILQIAYATLARNHAWWWANRDPKGLGLCSYGTSDVGEGLYKGTTFGARNESSMDNAPIHDEARYDPATRTLDAIDVGLNSLLALDAEMLGLIAAELGEEDAAAAHAARAEALRDKIRSELWDESRAIFANRLWSGAFVKSLGPTSFYPLLCGAATREQTDWLIEHLNDPKTFGGSQAIPGTARDDPAARDNSYWRGRIWPPLNYMVWQGLRRSGRHDEASALARRSFALFSAAWAKRLCPENYNAETGEPLDQPDTDGFYGWGALMPAIAVGEVMEVAPWGGWQIVNTGESLRLGPLESPAGPATLTVEAGVLTLARGASELLVTNLRGRLSDLSFADGYASVRLPDGVDGDGYVRLPSVDGRRILLTRIGERDALFTDDGGGILFDDLGPDAAGQTLRVVWAA
jgi:putative isomerase